MDTDQNLKVKLRLTKKKSLKESFLNNWEWKLLKSPTKMTECHQHSVFMLCKVVIRSLCLVFSRRWLDIRFLCKIIFQTVQDRPLPITEMDSTTKITQESTKNSKCKQMDIRCFNFGRQYYWNIYLPHNHSLTGCHFVSRLPLGNVPKIDETRLRRKLLSDYVGFVFVCSIVQNKLLQFDM